MRRRVTNCSGECVSKQQHFVAAWTGGHDEALKTVSTLCIFVTQGVFERVVDAAATSVVVRGEVAAAADAAFKGQDMAQGFLRVFAAGVDVNADVDAGTVDGRVGEHLYDFQTVSGSWGSCCGSFVEGIFVFVAESRVVTDGNP